MVDEPTLERIVDFHGHLCPGLAMGIRAAEAALVEVGPHAADEEVVAIVETDMCAVDAIQVLTGCTFGKGNLVHRDHGKNAFTFVRRSDGHAVRVRATGAMAGRDPAFDELFAKVRARAATSEERQRFWQLQEERSRRVLAAPLEELYAVDRVATPAPAPARIHRSVDCAACGEATMETRIRRLDGRDLCGPCFEEALAGTTPIAGPTR